MPIHDMMAAAGASVPPRERLDPMGSLSSRDGKNWFLCPERSQLSLQQGKNVVLHFPGSGDHPLPTAVLPLHSHTLMRPEQGILLSAWIWHSALRDVGTRCSSVGCSGSGQVTHGDSSAATRLCSNGGCCRGDARLQGGWRAAASRLGLF